jgi:hypothetical protein
MKDVKKLDVDRERLLINWKGFFRLVFMQVMHSVLKTKEMD